MSDGLGRAGGYSLLLSALPSQENIYRKKQCPAHEPGLGDTGSSMLRLIPAIFPILGLMRKEMLPSCQRSRFLMNKELLIFAK